MLTKKENFGEVNTDFSNLCPVLNMYRYIIGEEALDTLAEGCREVFDISWNNKVDDYIRGILIKEFYEIYDSWK